MRIHRLSTERVWALGYLIVVAGLVFSFYVDSRQDAYDRQRPADIAAAVTEANRRTIHCVQGVLEKDLTGTDELRDAARRRANADYEVKRLAIYGGIPLANRLVQDAWQDYKEAHEAYNAALKANPIPDVEAECGK